MPVMLRRLWYKVNTISNPIHTGSETKEEPRKALLGTQIRNDMGCIALRAMPVPGTAQPRTDSHADRSNRAFLPSLDGNNARSLNSPHIRPAHRAFLLNACSGSEPTDGPRPTHGRLRDGVWNPLYIAVAPLSRSQ